MMSTPHNMWRICLELLTMILTKQIIYLSNLKFLLHWWHQSSITVVLFSSPAIVKNLITSIGVKSRHHQILRTHVINVLCTVAALHEVTCLCHKRRNGKCTLNDWWTCLLLYFNRNKVFIMWRNFFLFLR